MDKKTLLSAAVADMQTCLPMLARSDARLHERVKEALRQLTGDHVDALAAREALQEVERRILDDNSAPMGVESERLLHIVRAADQKLTAALSAGHYSEG